MERYLILDIPLESAEKVAFEKLGFHLLDSQDLAGQLVFSSFWAKFQPTKTLVVFVGNGGKKVKDFLCDEWLAQWPWKANAFAKRFWQPGRDPYSIAHRFANGVYVGMTDVVIVDDVVSSGATVRKVKEVNSPWLPNTRWHFATLIAQRAAVTKGYVEHEAMAEVGTSQRKAPLNSISTFLDEPHIAEIYAQRNCGQLADEFLQLISQIRFPAHPVYMR